MEGDTTNFYIYRRLQNAHNQSPLTNNQSPIAHNQSPVTNSPSPIAHSQKLKISQIARGVAIGNELEYTDEITLGRTIINRIEFKG